LEWAKFWNLNCFSLLAFGAIFAPYSLIFKTHIALPSASEDSFLPTYYHSWYAWDNNNIAAPLAAVIIYYILHVAMIG